MSEAVKSKFLESRNFNSKFSRDRLMSDVNRRANVEKTFGLMCPYGHDEYYRERIIGTTCTATGCKEKGTKYSRYWYRSLSEMIATLSKEKYYLEQIIGCFAKIKGALQLGESDRCFGYYEGALYGPCMGER